MELIRNSCRAMFWLGAAVLASVPAFSQAMNADAAARFLDQATWGPTPTAIDQLQQVGIDAWLDWQFSLSVSDLPDQEIFTEAGTVITNIVPVQSAFVQNAIYSDDQLRQRVAFVLSQIWVVSHDTVTPAYAFPPYWRIFRDNAFGNYREVIRALTLNPAMGRYLNMANNVKANPARGTAANENYARELLQLFTLGLVELNLDGTPRLDANKNAIATYDQSVVTNLSAALTGWTYPTAPDATPRAANPAYYIGDMIPVAANHDTVAKKIFGGITIPARQTAQQDLDSVLDALMAQPTMAPFVSKQLIEHLVTSNPSPDYVARVAGVFRDNGAGVTGDLQAVVRAILTDPEARAGDDSSAALNPTFGHLREPILFLTSMLRGLSASVGDGNTIYSRSAQLSQDLFQAPSVFSYFSPQFRTEKGLLGPEFQIYSTQSAALRANTVNTAIYGTLDRFTSVDFSYFVAAGSTLDNLVRTIGAVFCHGRMSPDLFLAARTAAAANKAVLDQVKAALYVVLTSGEYQVIH